MATFSVTALVERIAPRLLWRYRIRTWKIDTGEKEQDLLPWLCCRSKLSIDVGAAHGTYVAHIMLYSSRVIAFEPRKDAAEALRSRFKNINLVSVEHVALSDSAGSVQMCVPAGRPMLSTIEPNNQLEGAPPSTIVTVARRRLDDYSFSSVGFIKIDVEGHEQAVLAGGRATLERERPVVLIEVEERHKTGSVLTIASFFGKIDYEGFFLLDNRLRSIREFDLARHQDRSNLDSVSRRVGVYVNNFIYIPRERLPQIPKSYR